MYTQGLKLMTLRIVCLCSVTLLIANSTFASTMENKTKSLTKAKRKVTKSARFKDDGRITNGKNVTIYQFPQIVQLIDKYNTDFFCGGTLVSEHHVVTAAHCLEDYSDPEEFSVVANATYLGEEGIVREVATTFINPEYNKETWDNDVAVLKLSEPLTFGNGVRKAELCRNSWKANEKVIVLGWGKTSEMSAVSSQQLQTVILETLTTQTCQKMRKHITPNMSCAKVHNGQDACQSDSGGPALYYGELCGVISFGYGCGREGRPAVFAKIPQVRDFILNSMEK